MSGSVDTAAASTPAVPGFDVIGARKEGYSDGEIATFLAKQTGFDLNGARKEGYKDPEIVGFLAPATLTKDTEPTGPTEYAPPAEPGGAPVAMGARSQSTAPSDDYVGTGAEGMKPVAESIGSALGRIGGAVDTGFREGAAAGTDIQGQPLITGLMRQGGGVVGGGMAALSQSLMEVFGEKGGRDALALLSTLPMAPEAAHATTLLKTMSPDVSPSASPTARVPQTPLEVARDLRADRAETLRNPEPATSAIPAPDPTITDFSGLTNPLPTRGQGVESVLAANNVDSAIAAAKNVTGTGPYRPVTVGEVAARDGLTDPSEAYRRVVAENAAGGRAAGIPDFDMVRDAGRSFNRGQPLEPVNEQPGLSGAYAGAAPPGYTRTDVGDVGGGGSPGVRAVYQSTASDASVPVFHEIGGDGTGETFAQNIAESKQGNKFGASVAVYPTDEYNQMRLFVTPDRGAGFALHGDDIVSVYRKPDGPKGVVSPILDLATQEGGRRLDAFDTVLPGIYGNNGFKAVARLAWNDAYAPEGWDFNTYRNFNGGRPDVVFMIYDPNHNLPYKAGDGIRVADYDAGVAAQDRALRQVGQPTEAPAEVVQSPTRRLPGIYGGEPDVTTGPFEPQAAGAAASSRDMTGGTLFGRSAREIKGQQADMELADLMKTPQPGDARDIIPGATQTKAEIELNPTVSRDAKGLRQEFREGFNDHEKANNELYHAWIDQVVPPREQVGTMKDIRETNWKNAEKTVFGDDPNGQPVNTADIVAHINDVFSDPIDKSNSYLKNAFKPFLEDMTDKKGNPIDMGAKELYGIRQEMGRKVKDMATDTDLAHVRDEFRDLINVTDGAITSGAPDYRTMMDQYREASIPINAAERLQNISTKITNGPDRVITFGKFDQYMKSLWMERNGPNPYAPAKDIPQATWDHLMQLHERLARSASADELARTKGSDTTQLMMEMMRKGMIGTAHAVAAKLTGGLGNIAIPLITKQIDTARAAKRVQSHLNPDLSNYPPVVP